MNSKTILGASLVAVFAVTLVVVVPAFALPSYIVVSGSSVTPNPAGTVTTFKISTNGNIPNVPDSYTNSKIVYGYAWVDAVPGNAVVVTIHPNIPRDSNQNPNLWHPHVTTLDSSLCITSLTSPQAGIGINGNSVQVHLPNSNFPAGSYTALATSFEVVLDGSCSLGLRVVAPST